MDALLSIYNWIVARSDTIVDAIAYLVLLASVIVKLTPTLKDDNYFKPIIKFIGKYISLNKYGPPKTGA